MTDTDGAFRLTARGAGQHTVRTLRIGYRPTQQRVALEAGESVTLAITLSDVPFTLETVRVTSRGACSRLVVDATSDLVDAWLQARAVIGASDATAPGGGFVATTVAYERRLSANATDVLEREAVLRSGFVTQSWEAQPADSLRRMGYVRTDANGWVHFYAPGLDALLSESFVSDHCLHFAPMRPGLVGLAFEPAPDRRRLSDIRGTLWLDSATSELRSIEFGYTNVAPEAAALAGGVVEFARLANGAWVVSRWSIRMPVVRAVSEPLRRGIRREVRRVTEVRERGGSLALALSGADTLWAAPRVHFYGHAIDSMSSAAIRGAAVGVRGDPPTLSDSNGHFRTGPLVPREYVLELRTPSLDSVPSAYARVVAVTGEPVIHTIRVPSADLVTAGICPRAPGGGIVMGRVSMAGADALPPVVRIVAEWVDGAPEGSLAGTRRWVETRVDASGQYRVCGLPLERAVTVWALADFAVAAPVTVEFERRVSRAHFTMVPGQPGATLLAYVFADSSHQPLLGVSVSIETLRQATESNDAGLARLANVPPGRHEVLIRRIGYGPVIAELDFLPNETVTRRIPLQRVLLLDSVSVSAQRIGPFMVGFEDHRQLGLGRFLTREDLAKRPAQTFESILRQFPGVTIKTDMSGHHSYLQGRLGCWAQVWLDGMRIYSKREGEPMFDLRTLSPDRLEAVEYYAGPAQTPARYSDLNSHCGVLVLWTRRSP